jgi:enamine deaminase RidA (YjgF/YER057c/UK114 family)
MLFQKRQVAHRLYVTASFPAAGEPSQQAVRLYERVAGELSDAGAAVVQERLYGALSACQAALSARAQALAAAGMAEPPCTYVEGRPVEGQGLAGLQILALRPSPDAQRTVADYAFESQVCGRLVKADGLRSLYLSDVAGRIPPAAPGLRRADGARRAFELAESALQAAGMSFADVVRTWIYLDDILGWYDDFNGVRNRFFAERGLRGGGPARPLPASTGIGGSNPARASCLIDLVAMQAAAGADVQRIPLSNPLQSEAYEYGSAFSRGLGVADGDALPIYVSGTASIDEAGRTVHVGDPAGQVERTLRNVQSLLEQAGASLADICHATVFFKPGVDPDVFAAVRERLGAPEFPAVLTRADICRPDLLFEIDAEAVRTRPV